MAHGKNAFAKREEEILEFWQKKKIFEKSVQRRKGSPVFSFYDGPPFATGLPHYGHLVASLMKDVIPRYQTMRGKYVERRWGWDCHGLPIENLIEKDLELKDKHDIEKMGVEKFCEACRGRVLEYAGEWKKIIPRFGRWVDMENDYKTMDPNYMESLWWAFQSLWEKKLVYQGHKSMHICPRCQTTLSNFEVTQGYKDVRDLSLIAKFELQDEPKTYLLAWTTTPWTLIGNVGLAVGASIDYVKVEGERGEKYIFAKKFFQSVEKKWKILERLKGVKLENRRYKPLFDYFIKKNLDNKENFYTVHTANFVSTEEGTGIVHIAPAFGEDDMNLGKEKNLPFIQHVKMDGTFTQDVKDFRGLQVKPKNNPQETDRIIAQHLEKQGLLFSQQEYAHSYPHCWRCDTPLLNYAATSWFIRVTEIKEKLIANNKKTRWMPEFLRDGRFGKWLEEARDWAISRNRYWGTPLPVWQCEAGISKKYCGNVIVIGSIRELEKLSGKKVHDLHKPTVDTIEFPCSKCGGAMRRISEVLDCWFESGSMPYAQFHYPFENKEKFTQSFPAEFIAEGLDQTRGWFYTLMVLATALFNKPAFHNVIVNGIVLDKNGKKLSKRFGNYSEPSEIFDRFSADAVRLYLLTSPVTKGDDLRFNESDLNDTLRNVFMLLENILSFYKTYAGQEAGGAPPGKKNILDDWIEARFSELVNTVTQNLENYDLPKAARPIEKFINDLSTWYLRRSRERFKQGDSRGIQVFGEILLGLSKLMAPFLPFTAEHLYQNFAVPGSGVKYRESVHLEDWTFPPKTLADRSERMPKILEEMELVRKIVEFGLAKRAEAKIKVRQPLNELRITNYELPDEYTELIKDELNIKKVTYKKGNELKVELDKNISDELKLEGEAREFIRQINQLRKQLRLTVADTVHIFYEGDIDEILKKFGNEIMKYTLAQKIERGAGEKEMRVNEKTVKITIEKI